MQGWSVNVEELAFGCCRGMGQILVALKPYKLGFWLWCNHDNVHVGAFWAGLFGRQNSDLPLCCLWGCLAGAVFTVSLNGLVVVDVRKGQARITQ